MVRGEVCWLSPCEAGVSRARKASMVRFQEMTLMVLCNWGERMNHSISCLFYSILYFQCWLYIQDKCSTVSLCLGLKSSITGCGGAEAG